MLYNLRMIDIRMFRRFYVPCDCRQVNRPVAVWPWRLCIDPRCYALSEATVYRCIWAVHMVSEPMQALRVLSVALRLMLALSWAAVNEVATTVLLQRQVDRQTSRWDCSVTVCSCFLIAWPVWRHSPQSRFRSPKSMPRH